MRWWWQVILYLLVAAGIFFFSYVYSWIRFHVIWTFNYEWKQKTLSPIWNKAGVIEIVGGAETGKTLLVILLTKYLRGRKWNNVPNNVPGCQDLKLSTLRKIWMGEYEEGLVGSNNVLLIDETWTFFGKRNCQLNNFSHHDLSSLLFFLSETSKTGFKIFYVNKLGAELPKAFNLLSSNKTAQIRTLGIRRYCKWFDKEYFYLDFEFITAGNTPTPEKITKKPPKRYELKKGHFFRQSSIPSIPSIPWFGKKQIFSLPFSQEELDLYDKSWNLDNVYKRQREMSIMDKLAADALIETCRYKQSRTQKLMEEDVILMWWKRNPDPARRKSMIVKGWELAKKKGLWKPAGERIEEEEKKLKSSFELGKINRDEYQERINNLTKRKLKLAIKIEEVENQQKGGENPFAEVPIKEKKGAKKPKSEPQL